MIARNSRGEASRLTASSPTVQGPQTPPGPAGVITLPNGEKSIPVTSVPSDQRLVVDQVQFSPNPIRSRTEPITVRVKVKDTRGYVVRDALVFLRSTPLVTRNAQDQKTGQDGWLQLTVTPERDFPELRPAYCRAVLREGVQAGRPRAGRRRRIPARPGRRSAETRRGVRPSSGAPPIRPVRLPREESPTSGAVMPSTRARSYRRHAALAAVVPRRPRARRRCGGPRERRAGQHRRPDDHRRRARRQGRSRRRTARGPNRARPHVQVPVAALQPLRRRRLVGQDLHRDQRRHTTDVHDRQRGHGQAHALPRVGRLEGRNHSGDQHGDIRRLHPERQSRRARRHRPSPEARSSARSSAEPPARGWATHRSRTRTSGSAATRKAMPATRSRARRARSTPWSTADQGRTVRLRVVARNSRGNADAFSSCDRRGPGQPVRWDDHPAERREVGRREDGPGGRSDSSSIRSSSTPTR